MKGLSVGWCSISAADAADSILSCVGLFDRRRFFAAGPLHVAATAADTVWLADGIIWSRSPKLPPAKAALEDVSRCPSPASILSFTSPSDVECCAIRGVAFRDCLAVAPTSAEPSLKIGTLKSSVQLLTTETFCRQHSWSVVWWSGR